MPKNKKVNIREIIAEKLKHMDRPTVSELAEVIRPYCKFSKSQLIERELRRKARRIMSSFKNSKGARIFYSDNKGVYVNVERRPDLVDLSKINRQLNRQYSGLNSAMKKIQNKIAKIVLNFKKK